MVMVRVRVRVRVGVKVRVRVRVRVRCNTSQRCLGNCALAAPRHRRDHEVFERC